MARRGILLAAVVLEDIGCPDSLGRCRLGTVVDHHCYVAVVGCLADTAAREHIAVHLGCFPEDNCSDFPESSEGFLEARVAGYSQRFGLVTAAEFVDRWDDFATAIEVAVHSCRLVIALGSADASRDLQKHRNLMISRSDIPNSDRKKKCERSLPVADAIDFRAQLLFSSSKDYKI